MNDQLANEQTLRYARELRGLYANERKQRRRAEETLARLEESYATTVRALAAALELRDDQTGAHAGRVTALAMQLAHAVAPELTRDTQLEYGFLLHDIGKIGIRDSVLLKPGSLDDDELAEMRRHTLLGEEIVASVSYLSGVAHQVVAAHHERWDGEGYPYRLGREEIPLPARIFSLADSFDAMTNDRPYRAALPLDLVLREIAAGAGTQFDPELAGEFAVLVSKAA